MSEQEPRRISLEEILTIEDREYGRNRIVRAQDKAEAFINAYDRKELSKVAATNKAEAIERRPNVRQYLAELQTIVRECIIAESPHAFDRIINLATTAESERVQLDANRFIVEKAGFKDPVALASLNIFNIMPRGEVAQAIKEGILEAAKLQQEDDDIIDVEAEPADGTS